MSRKNLVWLASYPKSGNTWTRILLANYLLNPSKPLSINEVHRIGMGDSVSGAYLKVNGGRYDPTDRMGHLKLRPKVLRAIANNGADLNFIKTHNVNDRAFGYRLIDANLTRSAVYIVRNPLDVVISYARHYGETPSQTCRTIGRTDNTVEADNTSVAQYLGKWSDHVQGWTRARGFPVHTVRYEDMQSDPIDAFTEMLKFLGIPVKDDVVEKAVRFSSFDELSKQETETGFIEQSKQNAKFFHSGTTRQWEGVLTDEDIAHVQETNEPMMRKFGYL